MSVILLLENNFFLSSLRPSDTTAYVKHLNDPLIQLTTDNIPYPYTQEHSTRWIDRHAQIAEVYGKPYLLAIRNSQEESIGAVGIGEIDPKNPYVAEIGYWLASAYWGRGIMTEAVRLFVGYSFSELNLLRLWTRVFEFNLRSRRVLEKNGFQLEGIQRQHIWRNRKLIDDYLYGLLKADLLKPC